MNHAVLIRRLGFWIFFLPALIICQSCVRPQPAATPDRPIAFTDYKPAHTRREVLEFTASDGKPLGYVRFFPTEQRNGIALVYLHGIESHAGWFEGPASMLADRGYDVYCLDRRGSGINRENRSFASGDVDAWPTLLADIHAFFQAVQPGTGHCALVGLSWGGKLAVAFALANPAHIDALVLITPGLVPQVDMGWGQKLGIAFSMLACPKAHFQLPLKPEMFTDDPAWQALIRRDPLRLRKATARFLMGSHNMDGFIDEHITGNQLPILLFLAGQDRIINNQATTDLLMRGGQRELQVKRYADHNHALQFEAPDRLVGDLDQWMLTHWSKTLTNVTPQEGRHVDHR